MRRIRKEKLTSVKLQEKLKLVNPRVTGKAKIAESTGKA
jgi:hypothetical protein